MDMRVRRRVVVVGVVALLVAGIVWLCRPRAQEYRWYVSPPLDAAGRRVKVLVPVGWEVDQDESTSVVAPLIAHQRVVITLRAATPMLLRLIRQALGRPATERARVTVAAALSLRGLGATKSDLLPGEQELPDGMESHTSIVSGSPPVYVYLSCVDTDRDVHRTLRATACNSLLIE